MRKIKSMACAVIAACFAFSMTLTGCSTPEYAMTVDGKSYTTGEYLAYLYNVYYALAQNMAMYQMYGMDPWEQTIPYGEGDDAEQLSTAEYIKRTAQDTIIRQKALENLLDQKNIPLDEDMLAEVEEILDGIEPNAYLPYGISDESFAKMLKATQVNDWSLFYGTYDKDIQDYRDRLDKYLAEFEKLGMTSENFDTIIEMKEEDDAPADETDGTSSDSSDTSSNPDDTSADSSDTTAPSNETTAPETTASEGTTAATDTDDTGDGEDEDGTESTTDPNRMDIDANVYGDEDFTNAVKKVEIGTASIQEYKKGGSTDTIALIYRMDPEQDRADGQNYYEEKRSDIIYGAKYEEYNKEVTDYMKTLEVSYVDRAIKACKPENFEKIAEQNS